jgi:hypothetical protein
MGERVPLAPSGLPVDLQGSRDRGCHPRQHSAASDASPRAGNPGAPGALDPDARQQPGGSNDAPGAKGSSTNVVFETARLQPGETYIVRFSYYNPELQGAQRVYVSAHDAGGRWLDIFPTGAGYSCEPANGWKSGAFGFGVPPNAASMVVWLRAKGTGSAEFRDVEVRQIVLVIPHGKGDHAVPLEKAIAR